MLKCPEVQCTSISHWDFEQVVQLTAEIRSSESPGGINHACELETSM